ncbi:MAG: HEPN domain-containing protein [Deltaproteobacteria bacterium]|nr:HEPN domain-containing protein [Deltaproteobacteria bacterium]
MFNTGRWISVAFMCQQAAERIVKGLYVLYLGDDVPKIHNIGILAGKF